MSKQPPRLTDGVIDGIISACAVYNACPSEFIGAEEEAWTADDKRTAKNIEKADKWARARRELRNIAKAEGK